MNVAVLVDPADARILIPVLGALRDAGLDARALKLRSDWSEVPAVQLESIFSPSSHFLAVVSAESAASTWLSFIAGYARGRERRLAVLRLDPDRKLPRFLDGLPVLDGFDELALYYETERAEYLVLERRRSARSALLERGISFHAEALAQCVREGDAKAVGLFLDAGFHPDSRDRSGVPLLCLAARERHRSIVELLLEAGASIDLQAEDRGYSALMDSAHAGNYDLVDFLLRRGANPNLASKDGQNALVIAVGRNDAKISKRLLDYGADADKSDKLGLSARKYARLFHDPAMSALFPEAK